MGIFRDILILLWELRDYLEFGYYEILHIPISQEILPNFGEGGIFRCHLGFVITSIFLSAEVRVECG